MAAHLPIGIDDFQKLREAGLEYVDKSHMIEELLDLEGVEVLLLPRPRRFGKTLNLSMLRCFFERRDEDLSPLFQDLRVWRAGPRCLAHFQRYPVIHLSLKGTGALRFEDCWAALREKIEALFDEHRELLDGGHLSDRAAKDYAAILDGTAGRQVYARALLDLSAHLRRRHGERVIILLDEYDDPIHAGYAHGYAPEILSFCRTFLTEGLKGNPHLFKAVLTGILRVAKESIFSGLNNVAVYSLLRPEFRDCFGFTEPEVEALLSRAGESARLDDVRGWYNGYIFGGQVVFNPWSVLSFLASADKRLRNYWVATSGNELVTRLLQQSALRLEPTLEVLLEGGAIERRLEESVSLGDLELHEDALWALLVFTGYLKAEEAPELPGLGPSYWLSIPNQEVRVVYATTFRQWLEGRLVGRGGSVERLKTALLHGDAEAFERQLQAFVTDVLSYHDPAVLDPEQVYQGFVLGLLATLEPEHQVRSNRESGQGRPDVLIRPARPGLPGVVLELKVARPSKNRTLAQALEEGARQIREKDYGAELRAAGASPVRAFAVAFDGKVVQVAAVEPAVAQGALPPGTPGG